MNLLMIQANGMTNGTTVASNSSNASSNSSVVLVDDEEDEGVATDATTEGQLNSKDIKSTSTTTTGKKPLIQTSRPRRSQGGKAKTKDVKDSTHGIAQGKSIILVLKTAIRMVFRMTWDCFPFIVYRMRKNLGIIPEEFINELLGNDARTLQECLLFWIDMFLIRQQQLLSFCSAVCHYASDVSICRLHFFQAHKHITNTSGIIPMEFEKSFSSCRPWETYP